MRITNRSKIQSDLKEHSKGISPRFYKKQFFLIPYLCKYLNCLPSVVETDIIERVKVQMLLAASGNSSFLCESSEVNHLEHYQLPESLSPMKSKRKMHLP